MREIIKILTILAFVSIYSLKTFASKEDSLLVLLKTSKDSARVNVLNNLAWEYLYNEPNKALSIAKKALELSNKLNYKKGQSNAFGRIGVVYDVTGKYDSAIFYYNKSLLVAQEINNTKGIGGAYTNLGLTYWNIGNYAKALDYFLQAITQFEKINSRIDLGVTYNNIGLVYFDYREYKKAKYYFLKSVKYNLETNNLNTLAACYSNIAGCYSDEEKIDSSLYYYNKALNLQRKINDNYGTAISLVDIGLLYSDQKNYLKSIEYLKEGLDYKKLVHDKWGEASTLILLSNIYVKNKQHNEALKMAEMAEKIAIEVKSYKLLSDLYLLLSDLYKQSNSTLALEYLQKHISAKDSVINGEKEKKIAELSTKFETETKEKEIKLLQQKNEIAELASQKNKQQRNIIAFASLSLLSVAFVLYSRVNLKRKIEKEKEKVEVEKSKLASVIAAQEQERKRISEELHDGIGQLLSAAKLNIAAIDNQENEKIKNAINLVDISCQEIRNISHNLMPAILVKAGLIDAVKQFANNINSTEKIRIDVDGKLNNKIENEKEIHIYRIIQELLNNILKYAKATKIDIQIADDETEIFISIEDNGIGFDKNNLEKSKGNGWQNIQSRLNIVQGTIEIDSKINNGTAVHIYVPIYKINV